MDLSIIIVNYNAADYLTDCLESIRNCLSGIQYEVCIVDNASNDSSKELIKSLFPEISLVTNHCNVGFAAAINIGVRSARGRYLMWLNPDTRVLNGGMAQLLEYLDATASVGIIGPQLLNTDRSVQLSCRSFPSYQTALFNRYSLLTRWFPKNRFTRDYLFTDWNHTTPRDVDWVSGACLLHRREVFDDLSGLDERFFMYMEDIDFCLRAKRKGWRVHYHPGLRVMHHIGGSSRQVPMSMLYELHRSIWRYYAKHFSRNLLKDILAVVVIWGRYLFLTLSGFVTDRRYKQTLSPLRC